MFCTNQDVKKLQTTDQIDQISFKSLPDKAWENMCQMISHD